MKKFFTLVLLCYLTNTLEAQAQKKYNVIFIIVDDMSIAIDAFGNEQAPSPNFSRLMQHGMLFKQTYCAYPLCCPSRTSLFSGTRPDSNGVVNNGTDDLRWKLGAGYRFLPEYFHDYNYRTESFGKVGPCGHEDQVSWDYTFKADHSKGHFDHVPTWWVDTTAKTIAQTGGSITADSLVAKIERPLATPYFYGLGLQTHNAFTPILDSWNITGDSTKKELVQLDRYGTKTDVKGYHSRLIHLPGAPSDDTLDIPKPAFNKDFYPNYTGRQVRDIRHAYYAELLEEDINLGQVLDELDKRNLWDSTIVVFCSDHGLQMGEHQGLYLKNTLFEESLRVPFVICAPGKMRGVVCYKPVEMLDIYATLIELCGLPSKPGLQGYSLVPLLENPNAAWSEGIFAQRALDLDKAKWDDPQARAVRTNKYHYNNWAEFGEELYDIQNDPHEYTNLANNTAYADVLKHMRKLLTKFEQGIAPPSYQKNVYYKDADGDGYGNNIQTTVAYFKPQGYSDKGGDCNDNNKEMNPGAKSCSSDASTSISLTEKVSVFPNPTTGNVTVTYNGNKSGPVYLNVYDMAGRLVFMKQENARTGNNSYQLSLRNLGSGVFDLELKLDDGNSLQRTKFIIETR